MADIYLSTNGWKAFAKGKTLDDKELVKALDALADNEKKKALDAREAALDAVEKALDKIAKAAKGDKGFVAYAGSMEKALKAERAATAKAIAEAAKAEKAKKDEDDDEEGEDDPVILTKGLLRQVRAIRGKDDVERNFLFSFAADQNALIIDKRKPSANHRKLLKESLGASMKPPVVGTVLWEKNALTFVTEKGGGSLSKRIKMALREQIGVKMAVRVRGLDGVIEEDLEEQQDAAQPAAGSAPKAPPAPPAPPDGQALAVAAALKRLQPAIDAIEAAVEKGGLAEEAQQLASRVLEAFKAGRDLAGDKEWGKAQLVLGKIEQTGALAKALRLTGVTTSSSADVPSPADPAREAAMALFRELEPVYLRLVKGAGGFAPEAAQTFGKVRLGWEGLSDAMGANQWPKALAILQKLRDSQVLAKLDALVPKAAAAPAPAAARPAAAPAPAAAGAGRLVKQRVFMLERWKKIPGELQADVSSLRDAVKASAADDDPDGLAKAVQAYLDGLLGRLQDRLDAAVSKGDTSIFQGLRAEVAKDELIVHLQANPFVPGQAFRDKVMRALDEIERAMTA